MIYAVIFAMLGLGLIAMAAVNGGIAWLLLWPAVSFFVVAAAYAGAGPRVLGKRPDGSLQPGWGAIALPFLMYSWAVWHALRLLSREPPWQEVAPQLRIGRRLLPREFPADVGLLVDVAAEFPEPGSNRVGRTYVSFPVLDASVPKVDDLVALAQKICKHDGVVLIHCAQGHGRSGLVAAAVLLCRGKATTVIDAIRQIRASRPGVRLNPQQRRVLNEVWRTLSSLPSSAWERTSRSFASI
jgi:protein-tyrosine phosphatase